MSKTVTIPDCANPFEVCINGKWYRYPAGQECEVPDEVAAVIEAHNKAYNIEPEAVEPPFSKDIREIIERTVTELIIPKGVKTIGEFAFQGCARLEKIILPKGLEGIADNAFTNCTSLTSITIPESVKKTGSMAFAGDVALKTVTFGGVPETINAGFFAICPNLKTINVPWAEGEVANAPWSADGATINYNYTGD